MIEVADSAGLSSLRHVRGAGHVRIRTATLKYDGLLPHALRYAMFALRPGGRLEIVDTGGEDVRLLPFVFPFNQVCMAAARFLHRDMVIEGIEPGAGIATYVRTRPEPEAGWSAGIVFSGAAGEVAQVERCVAALMRQPEIGGDRSRILICGPTESATHVSHLAATYVPYDASSQRFLIGAKKNALMAAMPGPRLLVLHARIELADQALANMPAEFDVCTPVVDVETGSHRLPYLDFVVVDDCDPARMLRGARTAPGYERSSYLDRLSRGWGVIDGGCFAIWKDVAEDQPMNPMLAWGEAEDAEWCWRLHHNGYLVDLIPGARAASATSKHRVSRLPVADNLAREVVTIGRRLSNRLRYQLGFRK
jgi:hypothetical protein